jgi:hypothetical protein
MLTRFTLASPLLLASFSLALALAQIGCVGDAGTDATASENPAGSDEAAPAEHVGSAEQAITNGWTGRTSEEFAPIVCDTGNLVNKFQCKGSYCDDLYAYCQTPGFGTFGNSSWTSYYSDEDPASYCPSGTYTTGFACTGRYCDGVSMQCTAFTNVTTNDCHWTGWVSDEDGPLDFGTGFYATGLQCKGRYCDDMRFWVCTPERY